MEEEFLENGLVQRFEEMLGNNDEYYFDTDELEDIIIYYLEIGDINYAELAVRYATRLHPNSIEIKTKRLEVLLELEQYSEAKKLINELQEISMDSMDFLVCCAKYYSSLGNPKRSIDYCKKALEYGEEENFLYNFIADEYINLDEPFLALNYYKNALEADPNDAYPLENIMSCYAKLKRPKEAIEFLNSYLDKYPYSETAWFEYGQFYFNRKNYREAIKGFNYILAINSEAVGIYSNKAACYEAMKDWEKAIETYQEMLLQEYTKAYTFYRIGLCYKEMKSTLNAIHAFQESLKEDPQFYLSMVELSFLYEQIGSVAEAIYYTEEAISLNENNIEYYKRLAFLYIDSNRFEDSLKCLKKITETEPEGFYNWYAYAEVLMLIEEYEEAVMVINRALNLHQRAELYYQLSNAYYNLNNKSEGKQSLEKALKLDDNLFEDMLRKYPNISREDKKGKKNLKDDIK